MAPDTAATVEPYSIGWKNHRQRILRPHIDRGGYVIVALCLDGRAYDRKVHRLVCEAFHGRSDLPEVRHLDGNPSNNTPDNLAWGTHADNVADRERHGRTLRGEDSPTAKLSAVQVAEIRAAHALARVGRQRVPRGWRAQVAARYGISVHGLATITAGRGYV